MKLDLLQEITVTVKILQGKHKGELISLPSTLEDILMGEDLPSLLFEKEIFESMGHPCDYFTLVSVEYETPEDSLKSN